MFSLVRAAGCAWARGLELMDAIDFFSQLVRSLVRRFNTDTRSLKASTEVWSRGLRTCERA